MSSRSEGPNEAPDPEREFLRVSELLMIKGVNLREVYPARLTRILGGEGAGATVVFLGEGAFSDPDLMLTKIKWIFGGLSPLLLNQLIDRANQVLNKKV
jgi:hypothetical protein